MKILWIDDNREFLVVYSSLLRHRGYEVTTAESGRDGIKLVDNMDFDLIITDLYLPDMSGIDVVKTIRRKREQIPILVMTAWASRKTAARAIKEGALDYIEKPFSSGDLQHNFLARLKEIELLSKGIRNPCSQ